MNVLFDFRICAGGKNKRDGNKQQEGCSEVSDSPRFLFDLSQYKGFFLNTTISVGSRLNQFSNDPSMFYTTFGLMERFLKYLPLIVLTSLLFFSCGPLVTNTEGVEDSESTVVKEKGIDYESEEMLTKFDTDHMEMPDTIVYFNEVQKANLGEEINYSALDSLYASGTGVSDTLYYQSSGGGLGISFSLSGGFQTTHGGGSSRTRETTAIEMALGSYASIPDIRGEKDKCFDLIHFLLSRGANPNVEGRFPLYECIRRMAGAYGRDEEHIKKVIDLYQFYGFDMKNLDLSASNGEEDLLQHLVEEGSNTYNMNTFGFESELRLVYDRRESLAEQGVVFDFSEIDGDTFPFDSDTIRLQLMLEMGLSPYHVTPEGKDLREDFSHFPKEVLQKVLDQYREDHPDRQ